MTTRTEISRWFDDGVAQKATHMIVVCDTYDHEDYPAYCTSDDHAIERHHYYTHAAMQRVMEVYDLRMDKEKQLNTHRVFNLPQPSNVGDNATTQPQS